MKIGFFYVPYYPLTAGRSVHGFHLVKGLKKLGHQVLSCTGEGNPDCINFDRTRSGAVKLARQADVLYIRIDIFSFLKKATLLKFVRPFSLPVVWEVNAPTEELQASFPPGEELNTLIHKENQRRRSFAKMVNAGIGVSEVLKDYIKNFLNIKNAYCIPNGSDPDHFAPDKLKETSLSLFHDKFKVFWMGGAGTP